MKVQNTGRVFIAKSVELERDVKPGEVTTIKPGFEKCERIAAMLQTGSLTTVVDGVMTESGATVAVQPGNEAPFEAWGKDLPLPKVAETLQKAQEKREAEAPVPEVLENTPIEEVPVITSTLLTEEQKANVVAGAVAEPKVEPIDELMTFLDKKGAARCRFVEQMTDLRALRAALAANTRSGATRQALEARIRQLSNVPESFPL